MSKIVITEKGKKIQRELLKEQFSLDLLHPNPYLETNTLDHSQNRSLSKIITLSRHEGDLSKSVANHKLSTILNEGNTINVANQYGYSSSFSQKKKDPSHESLDNNPYVKKRIKELARDMLKELSEKNLKYKSIDVPSLNSGQRQDTSFLHFSSISPSSTITGNLQNSYEYDEIINQTNDTVKNQFMVKNHFQLLHIESSIEKMLDRYKFNKRKLEDVEKKVLLKHENKKRNITEKNHKPPEFLEEIKQNNPEAIEILARKTNAPLRFKKRLGQIIKKEYQPYWDYFGGRATKQFASSSFPKNKN